MVSRVESINASNITDIDRVDTGQDDGVFDPYANPGLDQSQLESFRFTTELDDDDESNPRNIGRCPSACTKAAWGAYLTKLWVRFLFFLVSANRERKKRACQFWLGLSSIFFVVLITSVCFNVVDKASVILLVQGEGNSGQIDVLLTPSPRLNGGYLNYTSAAIYSAATEYRGHTPRMRFSTTPYMADCVTHMEETYEIVPHPTPNPEDPSQDNRFLYQFDQVGCFEESQNCLPTLCGAFASRGGQLVVTETAREKNIGLGRSSKVAPPRPYMVHIAEPLAIELNARPGDLLPITVNLNSLTSSTAASPNLLKQLHAFSFSHLTNSTDITTSFPSLDPEAPPGTETTMRWKDDIPEYLPFDVTLLLDHVISQYGSLVNIMVEVDQVVSSFGGRFSNDEEDLILIDYSSLLDLLLYSAHPVLKSNDLAYMALISRYDRPINEFPHTILPFNLPIVLKTTDNDLQISRNKDKTLAITPTLFHEFSSEIIINLPDSRVEWYMGSNYDDIQRKVIEFASLAIYQLGFPEVQVELPVIDALSPLAMFNLFLNLILSIVLTILSVLSLMLIYSLLMISVESRLFEVGVHRMIGLSRMSIVFMLLIQASTYSVPAWVVALLLAQVVNSILINILGNSVDATLNATMTPMAILVSSALGLLLPLIAAILPIAYVLSQSLRDSIDSRHTKVTGVEITIERSNTNGIPPTGLVLGVGLSVFGFLIYYLLPLSLVSLDLVLFFNIFFGILLGMLFGLILLSLNVNHLLEKFCVFLLLIWERGYMRRIVYANLVAHKDRSRKTTLMYALAIGFIIFITTAYKLELSASSIQTRKQMGSDLVVLTTNRNRVITRQNALDIETILTAYGTSPLQFDPALLNSGTSGVEQSKCELTWGWRTRDLLAITPIDTVRTSTISNIFEHSMYIHAISPSYIDSTDTSFYSATDTYGGNNIGLSASELLYTIPGQQRAIIDKGLADWTAIHLENDHPSTSSPSEADGTAIPRDAMMSTFKLKFFDRNRSYHQRMVSPVAIVTAAGGLSFTKRNQNQEYTMAISFDQYLQLGQTVGQGQFWDIQDLTFDRVVINTDHCPKSTVTRLKRSLQLYTAPRRLQLHSDDSNNDLQKAEGMLSLIFQIVTILVLILCMFSLLSSIAASVMSAATEIAVLRAIGLTKIHIYLLYIYESFILVISSALLGTIIGVVMAFTMILQRVLFTELPISFAFPTELLYVIIPIALVCSVVAAFIPVNAINRNTIAKTFKTFW